MPQLCAGAGAALAAWFFRETAARWLREFGPRLIRAAGAALILYFAFFVLYGGVVSWVAAELAPSPSGGAAALVIGVLAASWVIGFVTPGAAAGLGVREAALLLLLAPDVGRDAALVVALASRAINVGGDVLLALLGAALLSRSSLRAEP